MTGRTAREKLENYIGKRVAPNSSDQDYVGTVNSVKGGRLYIIWDNGGSTRKPLPLWSLDQLTIISDEVMEPIKQVERCLTIQDVSLFV